MYFSRAIRWWRQNGNISNRRRTLCAILHVFGSHVRNFHARTTKIYTLLNRHWLHLGIKWRRNPLVTFWVIAWHSFISTRNEQIAENAITNEVISIQYRVLYVIWAVQSESEVRLQLSWKLAKIGIIHFHFRFSTSGAILHRKWHRKLMMSWRCALRRTTLWLLKFCRSSKIDWDMTFLRFDLVFDLVT